MNTDLLAYILRLCFSLAFLLLIYLLLFKKSRNFRFNRFYLIFSLLFSLTIPTLKIHTDIESRLPVPRVDQILGIPSPKSDNLENHSEQALPGHRSSLVQKTISSNIVTPEKEVRSVSTGLLFWIYCAVGILLFLNFGVQMMKIVVLLSKSKRTRDKGFIYHVNPRVRAPFTFFRYIVINPSLYSERELIQILMHEYEHLNQLHFIEILILELLKPLLWFVPFVWIYDKEIKENHEYLADEGVVSKDSNLNLYHQTLLKGSLGMYYLGISSFLHKSFIKKRIAMMTLKKTNRIDRWKIAVLIPAFIVCILSCTRTTSHAEEKVNTVSSNIQELKLNTTYQFVERINGYFMYRGTIVFNSVDSTGIWQGVLLNFTQWNRYFINARFAGDDIEFIVPYPWNEKWKITSKINGKMQGTIQSENKLIQLTEATFELSDQVSISELVPDYQPRSTEHLVDGFPLLKNEKYYWELWDEETQTSALAGWYMFESYDPKTKAISGTQFNYHMQSNMQFTGTYIDGIVKINIGEPWNEVWTAELKGDIYDGEQTYNHNDENFQGNGIRYWRMSSRPFEDKFKAFNEIKEQ